MSLEVDDDVGEEADVDERPVRDLGQDAQVGVVVGAKVLLLASSKTMQHNFLLKRKCCSNRVWRCHELSQSYETLRVKIRVHFASKWYLFTRKITLYFFSQGFIGLALGRSISFF